MKSLTDIAGDRVGEIGYQTALADQQVGARQHPRREINLVGQFFQRVIENIHPPRGQKLVEGLSDDAEKLARLHLDMEALAADYFVDNVLH